MGRFRTRLGAALGVALGWQLWGVSTAGAIPLDKEGDLKLGVRAYVNARIGTQDTQTGDPIPVPRLSEITPDPRTGGVVTGGLTSTTGTFPYSPAGHLRQNRFFLEAEFDHNLTRLLKEGRGPFAFFQSLPFTIDKLGYHLTFRGERDGVYDWGPREFRTAEPFETLAVADLPSSAVGNEVGFNTTGFPLPLYRGQVHDPQAARRNLRKLGVHRERLFQAYIDMGIGDLFIRAGRQILSWGETDGFRLMDNINPLDASFGGFLVPLDERRVPLDMVRAQYYFGAVGPLSEIMLDSYVAFDDRVGFLPGTPEGSPWNLPSLGAPSLTTRSFKQGPSRSFDDFRGGARLVFNAFDATFSLAHYYTYFDTPAVQVVTRSERDPGRADRAAGAVPFTMGFNDGRLCLDGTSNCGAPVRAYQTAPKVQITGATTTFALPQLYTVVRSELAYFRGEPGFTQGQLDPFTFNLRHFPNPAYVPSSELARSTGGRTLRDSVNFVVGFDQNVWLRWLNPNQTFFVSTQFFYKHLLNAEGNGPIMQTDPRRGYQLPNPNREVLPIRWFSNDFYLDNSPFYNLQPVFITQPQNSFLQTLFITTQYKGGQVVPGLGMFYDWGGGFVVQPNITFVKDPFRFAIDYTFLHARTYKGGSGVSLLRDRDNVQFRLEYVI